MVQNSLYRDLLDHAASARLLRGCGGFRGFKDRLQKCIHFRVQDGNDLFQKNIYEGMLTKIRSAYVG